MARSVCLEDRADDAIAQERTNFIGGPSDDKRIDVVTLDSIGRGRYAVRSSPGRAAHPSLCRPAIIAQKHRLSKRYADACRHVQLSGSQRLPAVRHKHLAGATPF